MNQAPPDRIYAYVALMRAYAAGRLTGSEFEPIYLALFKNDPALRGADVYNSLAAVFHAVDDFAPGTTDEQFANADRDLRARVRSELATLEQVLGRLESR